MCGQTIHSYAGWTPKAEEYPIVRLERAAHKTRNWERFDQTQVLIIDEISMVSNFTLSRLDRIMRSARIASRPFGGVQVIITGDFYQLPPVKPFKHCFTCGGAMLENQDKYYCNEDDHMFLEEEKWAFCAPVWAKCDFRCFELTRIHRQADRVFSELLNKRRQGLSFSEEEEEMLFGPRPDFDDSKAVKIYPFRSKVAAINETQLNELPGEPIRFGCVDGYEWNRDLHPELEGRFDRLTPGDETCCFRAYAGEDRHRLDDSSRLKEGMPVILLANVDPKRRLVNGSRGTIVGFEHSVKELLPRARRSWKDKSMHGEWLLSGDHARYQEAEIRKFNARATDKRWPVVQFDDGVTCAIYPYCEVQELGVVHEDGTQERFSLMSRTQIPLVAGWAITTHKSQGMTLDRAIIDMSGSWECGQVYVALSRVRSLQGLKVYDLARGRAMRASGTVQAFMRRCFGKGQGVDG